MDVEEIYVLEQKVVVLEIENRSGALSRIARKLARADINIGYAYCTALPGQESGCLVLRTDEPEKAWEHLQGSHF